MPPGLGDCRPTQLARMTPWAAGAVRRPGRQLPGRRLQQERHLALRGVRVWQHLLPLHRRECRAAPPAALRFLLQALQTRALRSACLLPDHLTT